MFECYTERARRSIFYARELLSEYGSTIINTEYLLLGILRENPNVIPRSFHLKRPERFVRKWKEAIPRKVLRGTVACSRCGFPDKCILSYTPQAYGFFFDVDESRSSHSGGG